MSERMNGGSDRDEPGGSRSPPAAQPFLYLQRLTIVVLGILIAFALESWWSGRGEVRQARQSLVALQEDFEQNRARLDSVASALGTVRSAGAELLRVAHAEVAAPSADSLASLVAAAFRLAAFHPMTSAYDNLIHARDLGQVRDHELRLALASFTSQMAWLREVERWQNDQWILVNQPFLNDWIEVSDLAPWWTDESTSATLPSPRYRTDWQAALGDRRFRNLVMQRIIAADDMLRTQALVRHHVQVILGLLGRAMVQS